MNRPAAHYGARQGERALPGLGDGARDRPNVSPAGAEAGRSPETAPSAAFPEPPRTELETLARRADFLRVARGRRYRAPGMLVQARNRPGGHSTGAEAPSDSENPQSRPMAPELPHGADGGEARHAANPAGAIRVGFTCSKKVGNAVARNRAKRRLREVARSVLPASGRPGWDYVLIGLADATAGRPFGELESDLRTALRHLHGAAQKGGRDRRDKRDRRAGGRPARDGDRNGDSGSGSGSGR